MVLDKAIWGVSAFGLHLSNIFFDALSTVSLYLLALLLFGEFKFEGKDRAAIITGALITFYPMHVESVSWVSGRTDVLCTLFFILAFIFHILSSRTPPMIILAVAGFTLALMSKEVAVAFPLVALVLDLLSRRSWKRPSVAAYAVYAVLLALFLYVRERGFVNLLELSHERVLSSVSFFGSVSGLVELEGVIKVILVSYLYYFTNIIVRSSFFRSGLTHL